MTLKSLIASTAKRRRDLHSLLQLVRGCSTTCTERQGYTEWVKRAQKELKGKDPWQTLTWTTADVSEPINLIVSVWMLFSCAVDHVWQSCNTVVAPDGMHGYMVAWLHVTQ